MTIFDFWDLDNNRFFSGNNISKTFVDHSLKNSPMYINAAGLTSEDVKAEIKHGDILYITGESDRYGKKSIGVGIFIPKDVDQKSIELKVENGMIAVTFEHKREESKTIKVK